MPTPTDYLKKGALRVIEPAISFLARNNVSPNALTTIGTLLTVAAAVVYATGHIMSAGWLMSVTAAFDVIDGQVARRTGRCTVFGAFYDSTLDRIGESALFTGIAIYFLQGGVAHERLTFAIVACCAALGGSLLVSYTRARAESLDIECNTGIATRAERILLLGAPALFFGPGNRGTLLMWIVVALALATAITVVQRIVHVARATSPRGPGASRAARSRDTLPGHAPALPSRKGR